MSISMLCRYTKNWYNNFSPAQIKIRDATSNTASCPTESEMAEIAEMMNTDPLVFDEIMWIVWDRMSGSNKHWRHVYKCLLVLKYLITNGNDKVAQECRDRVFIFETLKDFHNAVLLDKGTDIRGKAGWLIRLVTDEEFLRKERARVTAMNKRIAQKNDLESSSMQRVTFSQYYIDGCPVDYRSEPSSPTDEDIHFELAIATGDNSENTSADNKTDKDSYQKTQSTVDRKVTTSQKGKIDLEGFFHGDEYWLQMTKPQPVVDLLTPNEECPNISTQSMFDRWALDAAKFKKVKPTYSSWNERELDVPDRAFWNSDRLVIIDDLASLMAENVSAGEMTTLEDNEHLTALELFYGDPVISARNPLVFPSKTANVAK